MKVRVRRDVHTDVTPADMIRALNHHKGQICGELEW